MKGLLTTAVTLLAAALRVSAFTNGTLIPAYICSPLNDGMPKSFGQLLTFTRNQVPVVSFNNITGDNVNPAPMFNATAPSMIANSAYILASCHNSVNTVTALDPGLQISIVGGGPVVAGAPNALNISTGDVNFALDGVMIWALNQNGQRVGSFTDMSSPPVFVNFPGCGLSLQGQPAGVVQNQLITDKSFFDQLVFNAPFDLQGNVTFKGLSVTDAGFGVFTLPFAVHPCTSQQQPPVIPTAAINSVINAVVPSALAHAGIPTTMAKVTHW